MDIASQKSNKVRFPGNINLIHSQTSKLLGKLNLNLEVKRPVVDREKSNPKMVHLLQEHSIIIEQKEE